MLRAILHKADSGQSRNLAHWQSTTQRLTLRAVGKVARSGSAVLAVQRAVSKSVQLLFHIA